MVVIKKSLTLVQEALGHASLNTSRIYMHFDSDKLKLAAKVAEDLANESAQSQSKLAILNLTNTKFKTSNLTMKLYKYVRIFSL